MVLGRECLRKKCLELVAKLLLLVEQLETVPLLKIRESAGCRSGSSLSLLKQGMKPLHRLLFLEEIQTGLRREARCVTHRRSGTGSYLLSIEPGGFRWKF